MLCIYMIIKTSFREKSNIERPHMLEGATMKGKIKQECSRWYAFNNFYVCNTKLNNGTMRRKKQDKTPHTVSQRKNGNTRFLINCHNKQRGSQYAYLRDLALTVDKCCWCFWFAFPFHVNGDFQIHAPEGACQVFS